MHVATPAGDVVAFYDNIAQKHWVLANIIKELVYLPVIKAPMPKITLFNDISGKMSGAPSPDTGTICMQFIDIAGSSAHVIKLRATNFV